MAFWSSERIHHEQAREIMVAGKDGETSAHHLIDGFKKNRVKSCKYELTLSREVIVTPDGTTSQPVPTDVPTLTIPPGQYAILYTQECVTIPDYAIAFISIKFGNTYKGLVNISGFHVDPGFCGHLKFSVYNAGNHPIYLDYESECFQIWFSDLSPDIVQIHPTKDIYNGEHKRQCKITPEDRSQMAERRHSPAGLNDRIQKLESRVDGIFAVGVIVIMPLLIGLAVAIFDHWIGERNDLAVKGELLDVGALIIVGSLLMGFFGCILYWLLKKPLGRLWRFVDIQLHRVERR